MKYSIVATVTSAASRRDRDRDRDRDRRSRSRDRRRDRDDDGDREPVRPSRKPRSRRTMGGWDQKPDEEGEGGGDAFAAGAAAVAALANGETLDGPDAPPPTKTAVYKTDIFALTGVNHAVLRETYAGTKVNADGTTNARPDMVCMYYLAGSCFQGDACTMRHLMDPEEIARKKAFSGLQIRALKVQSSSLTFPRARTCELLRARSRLYRSKQASKQASKQGRAVPLEEKRKETQVSARN